MEKIENFDDYVSGKPQWQRELRQLRETILASGLEEGVKWGAPVFMLNGKNIVGLAAFKEYVGVWFYNGAKLSDPNNILINAQQGKTKHLRQWRWSQNEVIDTKQLGKFLDEAIELQVCGKTPKPQAAQPLTLPTELVEAFKDKQKLKQQFELLTPYKQREYAEHIAGAKREATRIKRLEQSIVLIKAGVGLNDKYRSKKSS